MRKSIWLILALAAVAATLVALYQRSPRRNTPVITGPLTPQDVHEIEHFISRERAALVGGEFAPHDATNFAKHLRERAGGVLRRITSKDGQYAVVDFGDRWDSRQGYDYELQRTTNGWKITGVGGYRRP
jgi:hypothetical protein